MKGVVSGGVIILILAGLLLSGRLLSTHQPCSSTADCPTGEYCYLYSGICETLKSNGEYCTDNYMCASGNCVSNSCQGSVSCYPKGHSCTSSSQCCSPYVCNPYISQCSESSSRPTTTTIPGTTTTIPGQTTTTTLQGSNEYHGILIEPNKYCWDYCWSKDYAWGHCAYRNPSDSMNQYIEVGSLGDWDCYSLQKCYCFGHHIWSENQQSVVTTSTGDSSLDIVNNEDGSTTIIQTIDRRTSTTCEAICFRAGMDDGFCSSAIFVLPPDFYVGEKGEYDCSASQRCVCSSPYSDVDMNKIEDQYDHIANIFNETHIIREREEASGDPIWNFITKYWRTIILVVVVLYVLSYLKIIKRGK